MTALALTSIVLGADFEPMVNAWGGAPGLLAIGQVKIELGDCSFGIQSSSPDALRAMEEAFRAARDQLLTLIAEKDSALVNAPGADVLGEAASGAAEGEQPPPRPAAPPSNPPDGGL